MRLAGLLGVVCVAAGPVLADPVLYEFNVTTGTLTVEIDAAGANATGELDGTFGIAVYQDGGVVGASDTFLLGGIDVNNTDTVTLDVLGLATAKLQPGSARFLDFLPDGPDHIGPGGFAVVDTDVYAEVTVVVTGGFKTTFQTASWAGEPLPFDLTFTTSVTESDVLTVGLQFTNVYTVYVPDAGPYSLDVIVEIEGTAHAVPEPTLAGLTALGLGAAGAWLRRRRA